MVIRFGFEHALEIFLILDKKQKSFFKGFSKFAAKNPEFLTRGWSPIICLDQNHLTTSDPYGSLHFESNPPSNPFYLTRPIVEINFIVQLQGIKMAQLSK